MYAPPLDHQTRRGLGICEKSSSALVFLRNDKSEMTNSVYRGGEEEALVAGKTIAALKAFLLKPSSDKTHALIEQLSSEVKPGSIKVIERPDGSPVLAGDRAMIGEYLAHAVKELTQALTGVGREDRIGEIRRTAARVFRPNDG